VTEGRSRTLAYLKENLDRVFVLFFLIAMLGIFYFVPYKLTFLNLFFIPVILAGYFMGGRFAVLAAFFCFLLVAVFVYFFPEEFVFAPTEFALWLNVTTWGSFLLIVGYLLGALQQRFLSSSVLVGELHRKFDDASRSKLEAEREAEAAESRLSDTMEHKERLESALYSALDTRVAKLVVEGRVRNEKRRISVMFADMAGFTSFSDNHSPEAVIDEINKCFRHLEPVLLNYRGHIDKYLGDGIMVEFGAPVSYQLHALHAVVAGLKAQEVLKRHDFAWDMRVGIATGNAVIGLIGEKRQSYTAIGDTVNLASRLESLAPRGSVLFDQTTYDEIKEWVVCEPYRAFDASTDDAAALAELSVLTADLADDPDDPKLLTRIGKAHLALRHSTEAINFLQRSLRLAPEDTETKLAYADAQLTRDEYEKIDIKGKTAKVSVFRALRLKDPILDGGRLPKALFESMQHLEEKVAALAELVLPSEVVDGALGGHRIAGYLSYAIARELGLAEHDCEQILVGAAFRDIGKAMISPSTLTQEGALDDESLREVQRHVAEGVITLQTMGYDDQDVLAIVKHHHEAFDGRGYPDGLKGEAIPLGARIVAVADTYNALTSRRTYREAWETSAVIREIERGVGRGRHDPAVFAALERVMATYADDEGAA
jgi:HD-GYP domain-containing protein (c-di-GMP phosphodiesterase class II)/class 3 adenylate cyclase